MYKVDQNYIENFDYFFSWIREIVIFLFFNFVYECFKLQNFIFVGFEVRVFRKMVLEFKRRLARRIDCKIDQKNRKGKEVKRNSSYRIKKNFFKDRI